MRLKSFLPGLLCLAFAAIPAFADSFTFTIDHCTGTCGTAPFGTVDVTQAGTNKVEIDVSLNSADKFVSTGFPGLFGFDIVGNPTISVTDLTSGWHLLSPGAGNLHFDGFGDLGYALVCDICEHGASHPFAGPISFDVTAPGLTAASFDKLSTGDGKAYFVADILGANGNTGLVGATLDNTTTPEPGSLLLLGSGGFLLTSFSLFRRRKA